jgi:hypothetical protein
MTTPAPVFGAARRPRTPLTVDLTDGRIRADGHQVRFDPGEQDAAELAYLRLVRRMRDVHREPSFVLRSDDVEALANALDEDPVTVLERLGALMGATVTQRRSMVTAFLAGALLIVVATSAVALGSDPAPATDPSGPVDDLEVDTEVVGPPTAGDTSSVDGTALETGPPDTDPLGDTGSDGDTDPPTVDGPAAATTDTRPGADASGPGAPAGRSEVGTGAARGSVEDPPPRSPTADRDGAPAPAPAPVPAPVPEPEVHPSPDPAPPVTGEPDAWVWGQPRVDQPGAVIDLPPDPEDGEPGDTSEPPPDEDLDDEVAGDAA